MKIYYFEYFRSTKGKASVHAKTPAEAAEKMVEFLEQEQTSGDKEGTATSRETEVQTIDLTCMSVEDLRSDDHA